MENSAWHTSGLAKVVVFTIICFLLAVPGCWNIPFSEARVSFISCLLELGTLSLSQRDKRVLSVSEVAVLCNTIQINKYSLRSG